MIRKASEEDIPYMVDMAREFWSYTIYEEPFKEGDVALMIEECINNGIAFVYIDEKPVGFICAIVGPLLANFDVTVATEVAWWVNEGSRNSGAGIRLGVKMEEEAKRMGAKYSSLIYMNSSMPASLKAVYKKKMGYSENETIFTKVL